MWCSYMLAPTLTIHCAGGPTLPGTDLVVVVHYTHIVISNCTNVGSEMVSMVMVAITTVLNYNTSNRN